MSNILFANDATTTLASPISSGATSVTLISGTGALFPAPTGGQYFCLTFVDAATGLINEITHCTGRSGDTLTIVRGQEGTTAVSWLAGDTAANFLTAGTIAALQAGFPTGTEHLTANTTLSITDSGNFIRVGGTAVAITLPAAASVSGMPVGIFAGAACIVSIIGSGGAFAGGAVNGTTSVSLPAGDFICIQSDGTRWAVFSASPDILAGGAIALQSWVTANFDALGAAATAQANAEAYALALQGNYENVHNVTASTTFVTSDFGWVLRLSSATTGAKTFTIPIPQLGATFLIENNSSFSLVISVDGGNRFYGYVGGGSYQFALQPSITLPSGSVVEIVGVSTGVWLVDYNSLTWDPSGSATTAQANAEAFATTAASTAQANAETYAAAQAAAALATAQANIAGQASFSTGQTFTSANSGWLLRFAGSPTANRQFVFPVPFATGFYWVSNETTTFNLVVNCDGGNRFYGLISSGFTLGGGAQPTFTLTPGGAALMIAVGGFWLVVENSQAFDVNGAAAAAGAAAVTTAEAYTDTSVAALLTKIQTFAAIGSSFLFGSPTLFTANATYPGSTFGQAGTWRCMNSAGPVNQGAGSINVTLFVRIS